jgi:flagellar biosynthetic protein FliR
VTEWWQAFGWTRDPHHAVLLTGLVLARTVPMLLLNPILGGHAVPGRVKMSVSMVLALFLVPLFDSAPVEMPAMATYVALFLKELSIGAGIGVFSGLVFWGIATAGRLIDVQRGANLGETLVYQLRAQSSALGTFYMQLAIVAFLVLGGHHLFLRAWYESFRMVPPWSFPGWTAAEPALFAAVMDASARMFGIGLLLGGPPLLALVLTDVAFGLLNRVAPQINVFMLSMPAKMFVGVMMTLLVLPATLLLFEIHLGTMVSELSWVIALLGG